jgi:putative endonuclease
MFFVYILFSKSIQKYYVGSTHDLNDRIKRHNAGESNYTRKGAPWDLIHVIEMSTRAEAMQFEKRIKKRGIKRFIDDINTR